MVEFIKNFCGTNFTMEQEQLAQKLLDLNAKYYIIGNEICPTTNRKHLQFYCQLNKKRRFSSIGKNLNCHIEIPKGTAKQNIDYCMKDGQDRTSVKHIKLWKLGNFSQTNQ